ncbi:hypothetical protein [Shewanella colwelliana]|uniref:hypothetical protein n=1 Tax=Shewanella colwelliana TaxID=23 RepID=UPI001C7CB7B9|nr:hypothetical protein [Shewanella colwelliana]
MKVAFVVIVGLAIVAFFIFRSSDDNVLETDGGMVTVGDMSKLVSSLKASGSNGSFAVVLVPGTAGSDGYDANLQFSIANEKVGFDWVLLAERNIKDKEKVISLAKSNGMSCVSGTMNEVNFVRCSGRDEYAELGQKVLKEIYGVSSNQEMPLIITDFVWDKKT